VNKVKQAMTRCNIFTAGYSNIPIYLPDHPTIFVGVLPAKSTVALTFKDEVKVEQLSLYVLPVVRPDESYQKTFYVFRDRRVQIVLVTDRGTPDAT
jgi:metal transporter CNNM